LTSLHGNTAGLAPSEIRMLERLYRRRVPPELVTTVELAGALADASRALNRQVGVLLQRSGVVDFVVVGDAAQIDLPDIGRLRAGSGRFRGLRHVHTHLRGEPLTRDDLVDVTRLRLDLVAALGVSMDGRALSIEVAHSLPENDAGELVRRIGQRSARTGDGQRDPDEPVREISRRWRWCRRSGGCSTASAACTTHRPLCTRKSKSPRRT
jgi:GTP-binding protein HflX